MFVKSRTGGSQCGALRACWVAQGSVWRHGRCVWQEHHGGPIPCRKAALRPPCVWKVMRQATYGTAFDLKMRFIVKFSHKSLSEWFSYRTFAPQEAIREAARWREAARESASWACTMRAYLVKASVKSREMQFSGVLSAFRVFFSASCKTKSVNVP